jgi:FtsH-binding integral membrane protein
MEEITIQVFSSQTRVFGFLIVTLLTAAELGYQSGIGFSGHADAKSRDLSGSLQASILGLLALLLGFTFSMAVNRYDQRRDLVVEEANSIATTFLRASFLPTQEKEEIKSILRRYVRNRVDFYEAGRSMEKVIETEQKAHEIQKEIWRLSVRAGVALNTPLTATFVNSLNETIDLDSKRLAAMRNHVPAAVWMLLVLVGFCGVGVTGYQVGLSGKRMWFNQALFPLLIASVITILVDLDSPRRGLVGISQQSLIDLEKSLERPDTH